MSNKTIPEAKKTKTPYYIKTVTTVPQKLFVASMAKSDMATYMHALVKVLFFSSQNNNIRFLSITETPDEISLILNEDSIKQFPLNSIKFDLKKPWFAIQFSMGSSPLETQGFIGDIAGPLAKAGINIFFFTTFNNDFILVEEAKYYATRNIIESNFPIVWVDSEPTEISEPQSPRLSSRTGLEGIHPESFPKLQAFPQLLLVLTGTSRTKLEGSISDLIELLFYPTNTFRFLSFTQTEDEVSLIIDTNTLKQFPKEKLQIVLDEKTWVPIMRTQKKWFYRNRSCQCNCKSSSQYEHVIP